MPVAVFRADASHAVGSGHVMRCLTLARALADSGVGVHFVCRALDGHLCDLIESQGFRASRLPAGGATDVGEDADQTRSAIHAAGPDPDWLVVDHYALDRLWEQALRGDAKQIMAIDDLADRCHDCDLLLDQNLVAEQETRYAGKVPPGCRTLLGPDYALLQPLYAKMREGIAPRRGPIRRVLISFGGGDADNVTGRALAAVVRRAAPGVAVDVVLSAGNPHADAVRRQAAGHVGVHVHQGLPSLALLIAEADLAIGAGGATNWERLCLGLPTLVVTIADNQRPIAEELDRQGMIRWLGDKDAIDETALSQAFGDVMQEARQGLSEEWSRRCLAVVDGRGTHRVRAALMVSETTPLTARWARPDDEALLLRWANDPVTRRHALSPHTIQADTHRTWFHTRLNRPESCRLYILETSDGVALGQVRFERAAAAWEVHYAVAPAFRGRGVGRRLLEEALLVFRAELNHASIFGRVKSDNMPSRKIFESLGFARRSPAGEPIVYERPL